MTFKRISPTDGDYVELVGLGGSVNFPAALIHAALELGGYEVEVNNAHGQNPKDPWFVNKEQYTAYLTGAEPWPVRKSKRKEKIQLNVKHVPWGG